MLLLLSVALEEKKSTHLCPNFNLLTGDYKLHWTEEFSVEFSCLFMNLSLMSENKFKSQHQISLVISSNIFPEYCIFAGLTVLQYSKLSK